MLVAATAAIRGGTIPGVAHASAQATNPIPYGVR